MKTDPNRPELRIDPFETPVWALYTSNDDAQIIHGCLSRYYPRDDRDLPTRMWSEGGVWTGRSRWYATEEGLIRGEGIKPSCTSCKKPFTTTNWCDPLPKQLTERNLCFSCNHWIYTVIAPIGAGAAGRLVIEGEVYSYDPRKPMVRIDGSGAGYGFGGRLFRIRLLKDMVMGLNEPDLKAGTEVQTNNLWGGGVIPDRFRACLPDNAVFIKYPDPIGHGQGFLS